MNRDTAILRDDLRLLRARVGRLETEIELLRRGFPGNLGLGEAAPGESPVAQGKLESLVAKRSDAAASSAFVPDIARADRPTADRPGPGAPGTPPTAGPVSANRRGKSDPWSMERLIGGRLYAVLGALVVVAGAGLFLKLAWDRGWFQVLPDAWKCVLAASFGGALLIAGEVVRRRWGAIASIGCSAAGLGVVYASAYASYGAFDLVGHRLGFAMLIATAALGVLVGARARLVSIAVVAMVGGYLAPLFFLDVEPRPIVLPSYFLALLATGLALCLWLRGNFTVLRGVAWWGTTIFGGLWALRTGDEHPMITLGFLALAWGAVQGELLMSAMRGGAATREFGLDAPITRSAWSRVRPMSVCLSTSAWAGFLAGVVMEWWHDAAWMAAAAGFALTSALWLSLGGHLRVLRDRPENDIERLGAVFAVQAGVFLLATVALGLAGWLEAMVWLAMGVSAVVAGRWLRARPLDVYGVVALGIATVRLVLYDKLAPGPLSVGTDVAGVFLTRWSAMMFAAGAAWIGAGELIRRSTAPRDGWRGGSIAVQIVGALLLSISVLDAQTSPTSVAWMWLAMAAISFAVGVVTRRGEWRWSGVAGVAPALLAGAVSYEMWDWTLISAPPLAHAAWWLCVASAVAWLVMGRRLHAREAAMNARTLGLAVAISAGGLLFIASSLEVARVVPALTDTQAAQRAAVSIWWGLCAVGLLAAGFAGRTAPVRYLGLGLLGVATLKAVVFDLADVSAGWRVASFVLLGVLMIGVAAVYSRVAQVFDGSGRDQSADETGLGTDGALAAAAEGA